LTRSQTNQQHPNPQPNPPPPPPPTTPTPQNQRVPDLEVPRDECRPSNWSQSPNLLRHGPRSLATLISFNRWLESSVAFLPDTPLKPTTGSTRSMFSSTFGGIPLLNAAQKPPPIPPTETEATLGTPLFFVQAGAHNPPPTAKFLVPVPQFLFSPPPPPVPPSPEIAFSVEKSP